MNLCLRDLTLIKKSDLINTNGMYLSNFGGVSINSRTCRRNDLFIAIRGEKFDGHDFVAEVVKTGVKCVVVNKKWYKNLNLTSKRNLGETCIVLVDNTVKALGEIAALYRRKFAIPVIGIGGSNGKTTTKDLIAEVLSSTYNTLKTEGNYNNHIGVPLTLFRLNRNHEIAVIELGINKPGEMLYLSEIVQPQFAVITNIGKEHMEYLGNVSRVAVEEAVLVDYLKKVYGTFIKNTDDGYVSKMGKSSRIKKFTYGSAGTEDVSGKFIGMNGFFPEMQLNYKNKIINMKLKMIGYQGYHTTLSAAAVGIYFDVPLNIIRGIASGFRVKSRGRNDLLNINGTWVIDDTYNSNPDSVKSALNNLKLYKSTGEIYIVLGDMLELGRYSVREHRAIGRLIKSMGFRNLFTFGKEAYNIYLGAKGLSNNLYFTEKKLLVEVLRSVIRKNDIILVKGSRAMKMEEIISGLGK